MTLTSTFLSRLSASRRLGCLLAASFLLPAIAAATPPAPDLSALAPTGWEPSSIGSGISELDSVYVVHRGEFLSGVTGMHGVPFRRVVRENGIEKPDWIDPGQEVRVHGRWIVPGRIANGVILNAAEPKLYWFADSSLVAVFAVGVGERHWETPVGSYRVVGRREHPVWHVPVSIQKEMELEGKEVVERVAAGPENPLGDYWISLSLPAYGLHGTNAPSSVGQFSSHGCIRLHPANIERLYRELPDSARVEIIYEPVKAVCIPEREEVYLEVHSDHYRRVGGELARARELITALGCDGLVDWDLAARVVQDAEGIAVRVSRPWPGAPADPFAPAGYRAQMAAAEGDAAPAGPVVSGVSAKAPAPPGGSAAAPDSLPAAVIDGGGD